MSNDDWLPFAPLDPQEHQKPPRPENPNRVPMILGAVAGVLLVAVIVVVSVYLLRATEPTTAAPAPTQSSQAPPQPTPSTPQEPEQSEPAEEEPPAAASTVVMNGAGFTVKTADGEVSHKWADDAAPAIAALTKAFGTAPKEDFVNGDAENWAYDIYVWPGFRLYDVFLGDGGRSRSEVPAPTWVTVSSGVPQDVQITNEFGVAVGDSLDQARSKGPFDEFALPNGHVRLTFGEGRGTFYSNGKREFSAFVDSDESAQKVASITYTFRARGQ